MIRGVGRNRGDQRGQMPNALGIGLLGPLQVRDETGSLVHVGGRQLRVLLTLLALNAGRVVPVGSLAGELWPDDPPGNPGNALQTLVSRLRAELRQAGAADVIESHPSGYRLAVPPGAVDVMAFEELAAQGCRAPGRGDRRLPRGPRAARRPARGGPVRPARAGLSQHLAGWGAEGWGRTGRGGGPGTALRLPGADAPDQFRRPRRGPAPGAEEP